MAEEKKEHKVYVVPLGKVYNIPRTVRSKAAVKMVKDYIKKHVKEEDVRISDGLNRKIWERGIEKPPRKIKVKVSEEDGILTAEPVD